MMTELEEIEQAIDAAMSHVREDRDHKVFEDEKAWLLEEIKRICIIL